MAKASKTIAQISSAPPKSKGLLQSLTVWGGLIGYLPLLTKILDIVMTIPPELIADTRQLIVSTIAATMVIIGRWKAQLTISGLWGKK